MRHGSRSNEQEAVITRDETDTSNQGRKCIPDSSNYSTDG